MVFFFRVISSLFCFIVCYLIATLICISRFRVVSLKRGCQGGLTSLIFAKSLFPVEFCFLFKNLRTQAPFYSYFDDDNGKFS